MNHFMLDLETLGSGPDGAILTIGVVPFDPAQGRTAALLDVFYGRVTLGCTNFGEIDAGNVAWWMEQDIVAREEALGVLGVERRNLWDTLWALNQWLFSRGMRKAGEDGPWRLWAKPPEYDVRLLRAAYKRVGLAFPFHFRATRDMRTLVDLAQSLGLKSAVEERSTLRHHALEDAKHQAEVVCGIYQEMRRTRQAPGKTLEGIVEYMNDPGERRYHHIIASILERGGYLK